MSTVTACLAQQLRALADRIDPPPPCEPADDIHGIAEQARHLAERILGGQL